MSHTCCKQAITVHSAVYKDEADVSFYYKIILSGEKRFEVIIKTVSSKAGNNSSLVTFYYFPSLLSVFLG